MPLEEVRIPDIGDIDDVDVIEVLVAEGDELAKDDSLISLESDKATMDVPSPAAGTVRELKIKAGDRVKSGDLILILDAAAATADTSGISSLEAPSEAGAEASPAEASRTDTGPSPESPAAAGTGAPVAPVAAQAAHPAGAAQSPGETPGANRPAPTDPQAGQVYASPAVRRLARELGVDLSRVRGTGRKNRILKEDVQDHVKKTLSQPTGGSAVPPVPVIDFSKFGQVELVPMSRVQKISGPNLQRSWLNAPHVTQHDEADITELEAFRQQHKAKAKEEGFSLTPLAFVMKVVVAALREFPRLNSSLDPDGQHVVFKKYYNIGVAVDTADGLIVPVVRDVDKKGIFDLARELAETSVQARARKLRPDQLQGASFTISSLGGIGGTFFTPIINVPEVAILGVSRSEIKPVWQDGEFVPRLMLPLSLSYDHRVIDGAMAVRFTTHLSALLADIRRLVL